MILHKNQITTFSVDWESFYSSFQILENVVNFFREKGENVIYFPLVKTFNYSLEETESILLAFKLKTGESLLQAIKDILDIEIHKWDLQKIKKGEVISGGALRILNYLTTVYAVPKNSIIIINKYEDGLHPTIKIQ